MKVLPNIFKGQINWSKYQEHSLMMLANIFQYKINHVNLQVKIHAHLQCQGKNNEKQMPLIGQF